MKHLILGSSGQIGSALVDYLGYNVTKFDIVDGAEQDLRVENNPLLDAYVADADFVYFLAFDVGGSKYLKKYQHTYEFIDNNVRIMKNTFDTLRKHKKPFIFASSQMSNMSHSVYGVLKNLGEFYTKILNGVVVKFWNVYGVEDDLNKSHVITDLILKSFRNGKIKVESSGHEKRQFLFSYDACAALRKLASLYDSVDRTKNLHITSFEWVSIRQIAETISANMNGIPIEYTEDKEDTVQQGILNEPDPYILEIWQPKKSLEAGIKYLIPYYRNKYGYRHSTPDNFTSEEHGRL